MKKAILAVLCTGVIVSGCSQENKEAGDPTVESIPQVEAPTAVSSVVDELRNGIGGHSKTFEVNVDEKSSRMLHEAGSDIRNAWYFEQLRRSGIVEDNTRSLDVRSQVCSQMSKGKTVDKISSDLNSQGYTAEQQGVIIASSMISQCSDIPLIADQKFNPSRT